jgi:RNAse (barnase) inhibitor barstar
MVKPVVTIDGGGFADLQGFFDQFQQGALLEAAWGRSLDAFNDVLRGGFGTQTGGFVLLWRHHALSRHRLGQAETARQLRRMLATCHPQKRVSIARDLSLALSNKGSTAYDWLLDSIRGHGPEGAESADGVELRLHTAAADIGSRAEFFIFCLRGTPEHCKPDAQTRALGAANVNSR